MHAALCPSSYGSLLSGLMAPLLLGFTPAGARIVAWVAQPFGHWLAEALLGSLVILMMVWLLSVPFCGVAAHRAARLRAVHPDLGRLGGGPAQELRDRSGDWRGSARRVLHADAVRAGVVVDVRCSGCRRPGGVAVFRLPGPRRAGVQPVHPDAGGAAA